MHTDSRAMVQVMQAALARGVAPSQAAAAAGRAFEDAQAGMARASEVEKSFTSTVLPLLAVLRPAY